MSALEELQAAAATVADRVGPATVSIGRDGRGTGVVIAEGRVVTNAHNLRDRTTQVTFTDGHAAQAEVLGADVEGDLVVLGVETAGITPVEWSTAEAVVGQAVFAVARGRHGQRVTFGLVSGIGHTFRGPRGRRITGSIEHTAPLARGSSGGPIADADGRLLGLNTRRMGEGFYLAIPTDAALRDRLAELSAGRSTSRRRLGISVVPSAVARRLRRSVGLPDRDGLLVRGVEGGSPADDAGLTAGDLIVKAGDRDIATADDLWEVLDALGAGTAIALGIVRGTEHLVIEVSFTDETAETGQGDAAGTGAGVGESGPPAE